MAKKTKILTGVIVILFLMNCLCGYALLEKRRKEHILSQMTITFRNDKTIVEYGEQADSASLVTSTIGTITSYPVLDTMTLGKQKLVYTLSYDGIEKTIEHTVEIQDTKKPKITLKRKRVQLAYGEAFQPGDNVKSVRDPVDGDLHKTESEQTGSYWFSGNVDVQKAGVYMVTVHAQDQSGNQEEQSFSVLVKEKKGVLTNIGSQPTTEPYYVKGILLVNKKHALPKTYGGEDTTALSALQQLQAGAQKAGYAMPRLSGYRSYEYQESLYNYYVSLDGQALADTYSARPGHSEHQSGLAFDVGKLDNDFGYTPAGKWLTAHCADYGFILRYPLGKEAITGYQYEPWHVRYVGVDVAKEIMSSNLTLEEYLGD